MTVNAINVASSFYILESLDLLVKPEFGCHSGEKLKKDIQVFKSRFIPKVAQMLYDYSVLALIGEARHAYRSSNYRINDEVEGFYYEYDDYDNERIRVPATSLKRIIHPESRYDVSIGNNRRECYINAREYEPVNALIMLEKLFSCFKWEEGYGGEKWGYIANRMLLFDKIDNAIFCDMCFSLSHNNSPYLDKNEIGVFELRNPRNYEKMLDTKLLKTVEETVCLYSRYAGDELFSLIKRANTLGYLNVDKRFLIKYKNNRANKNEEGVLTYKRVKFENKKFIVKVPNEVKTRPQRREKRGNTGNNEFNSLKKGETCFIDINGKYQTGVAETNFYNNKGFVIGNNSSVNGTKTFKENDLIITERRNIGRVLTIDMNLGIALCKNNKGNWIYPILDAAVIDNKYFEIINTIYDNKIKNSEDVKLLLEKESGYFPCKENNLESNNLINVRTGDLIETTTRTGLYNENSFTKKYFMVKSLIGNVSKTIVSEPVGLITGEESRYISKTEMSLKQKRINVTKVNVVTKINKKLNIVKTRPEYIIVKSKKGVFIIDTFSKAWNDFKTSDNKFNEKALIPYYEGFEKDLTYYNQVLSTKTVKSIDNVCYKVNPEIKSKYEEDNGMGVAYNPDLLEHINVCNQPTEPVHKVYGLEYQYGKSLGKTVIG